VKEYALDALSPREIQFRVRAGESPEAISAETGWQLDRVLRYAEPPLGERAYVAERAQATYVHSTRGGSTLAEIVFDITKSNALVWDSFYRNGQWIISAKLDGSEALWNFEPTGKTVHPLNDVARSWMGVAPVRPAPGKSSELHGIPADTQDTRSSVNDTVVIAVPEPVRLVAVPELKPDHELNAVSELNPVSELNAVSELDAELPLELNPDSRVTAKKSKRGRAKVPSWDEILFGGPKETS
jgi:hypothetical protein